MIEGNLHINTPLIIPSLNLDLGIVISIQNDHKDVKIAKTGSTVSIKINNDENQSIMYGRQFNDKNNLYSRLTGKSLDVLKEYFLLLVKIKKIMDL